jgi:hypothetical protein
MLHFINIKNNMRRRTMQVDIWTFVREVPLYSAASRTYGPHTNGEAEVIAPSK